MARVSSQPRSSTFSCQQRLGHRQKFRGDFPVDEQRLAALQTEGATSWRYR
jgi:hypothetical protein